MNYIIDGYNLLFRLLHSGENISERREELILSFAEHAMQAEMNMTIVFDSHFQNTLLQRKHIRNLEVVYTDMGETADDHILSLLKRHENPKNCMVVTSDNQLSWRCRRQLAKTQSVETFLKVLKHRVQRKRTLKKDSKKVEPHKKKIKKDLPKIDLVEKDELSNYYLDTFNNRLKEMEHSRNKVLSKKDSDETIIESEMARWLRLFQEKLKSENGA